FVAQATISIEDKNFYRNPGVDWRGIIRSIYVDITSGSKSQGGSTITQQFVRNAILTRQKSLVRKVKEAVLAIEIDQKFSKDDILKLYLNEIPYGQNAYGIQAASLTYFGKQAKDIDLAQAAYLASLPQAPSLYNPNGPNRDRLDARHEAVLTAMYEQGYISKEQMEQAKAEVVVFSKIKDFIQAPHFVTYIEQQLAERYGQKTLEEGGLSVITTLDWTMQTAAEQAVKDGVARNTKSNKANNAGLVAMDPKTGQILAMVGSADYFNDEINGQVNVTLRPLQPGSSFKPYVYATAFKQGMSPATMLVDVKTSFGTYGGKDYAPSNYDGQNHGIVNIRKALAGSLNIPAVKTLALVGVQNAIDTAKDMGITSDINSDKCGLSLVLGGCEITLLDHTGAFGVFANMGTKHNTSDILKVLDSQGKTLEEWHEDTGTEALDPQVAYEIISIMTDNNARTFVFGPNSPLILPDRIVAAKTGTTQAWKDGWTMGYTPSLVAGVWTGNTNGSPMRAGADGVITAGPIWHQFMLNALKGTPAENFQEPPGIQHLQVDSISGKLPTQYTPNTKEEVFASFAIPTGFDDVHIAKQINKLNGKLANSQTPTDLVETRIYTAIHSEQPENPNWEIPVRAWAQSAGYSYPPTEEDDGTVDPGLTQTGGLRFLTPTAGQEINGLPFLVQVDIGANQVNSVDLSLDGIPQGSRSSSPYTFFVNSAKNGDHQILIATAHLTNGSMISSSIPISINVKQ
ncbi:MAG: PBP1A family penicillin-binding protein, partial [Candidatus Doudnabacteria bacterium]|nr:PBP1A family penicillin-binding protein [Candidatus Doudnabacteria bacterium]